MTQSPTIAAVLIVKNEAEQLAQCLTSLEKFVDEIVILDGGSTDNTVEIGSRFTEKTYIDSTWQGFGLQRQKAQKYVQSDWIFWVDADERFTPELGLEIKNVIQTASTQSVYSVPRLSWVFGHCIRYCGWYPDRVLRLHPTHLTHYNDALVHEKLIIKDTMRILPLRADLLHFTYRDLEHYLVKSAKYAHMWAEQGYQAGKRAYLSTALAHGIGCFLRMFILNRGFLDGRFGFLLSLLSAHSTFAKYVALWLKIKNPKPTAKPAARQALDQ